MFKSVLLTNLDWSRLLHIGHVCLRVFMERDKVDIYKSAKRTRPIQLVDPGKGPGRSAPPPPICLEQNEARTAIKFVFGDRPHLSQSLDNCPHPPPPPPPLIWRSGSATAYPAILTEQAWSINDLLHGQKEKVLGERLESIFPARTANQNTGFASPCSLQCQPYTINYSSDHFKCQTSNLLSF